MTEAETKIAAVVVEHLRADGWDVYQEVRMGGADSAPIHDIVAVRPGIWWVIEAKRALTFEVVGQVVRAWYATLRSVAVPAVKRREYGRWPFAYRVCEEFGVGVLRVDWGIETVVAPAHQRIGERGKRHWDRWLVPEQRTFCDAGARTGYWTPWKQTMQAVTRHVAEHPGCTMADIVRSLGSMHYSSTAAFANGIRCALRDGLVREIRRERVGRGWRFYAQEEPR